VSDEQQRQPAPSGRNVNPKLVVAAIVAVVLVLFAVLNTHDTNVDFIADSVNAPLIVVIVVSALLGMLLGALLRRRARHHQS
jgi:uncharacterized integral membrane protein